MSSRFYVQVQHAKMHRCAHSEVETRKVVIKSAQGAKRVKTNKAMVILD